MSHSIATWLEDGTLMSRRKKAAAETVQSSWGCQSSIEYHEAGQITGLASQAIGSPGTHGWSSCKAESGVKEVVGIGVFGELACHGSDDAEIIGTASDMGKQFTDLMSAFTMTREFPG